MEKYFRSVLGILVCFFLVLICFVSGSLAVRDNDHDAHARVQLPVTARLSERIVGLPGLSNVGRIAPGIYRGNQPLPEGYETLKKMGIRTIINFRALHDERSKVEAAGMRSIEYPVSMLEKPSRAQIEMIVRTMADPAYQPVYIHCALGKDRTGIIVAAYRMDIDGWDLNDAIEEMEAYGFNNAWIHLKQFIIEYGNNRNH